MRFTLLTLGWLLLVGVAATAQTKRAAPLLEKMRVSNVEVDGKTMMLASGKDVCLRFSAATIAYQQRGNAPFERTVLSGNAKLNSDASTKYRITGHKIALDTAVSELQVDAGECFEDAPWKVLQDSLTRAPHTPRVRLMWYAAAFNNTSTYTMVYDRRTQEMATFGWFTTAGEKPKHERKVEKGVTEATIQQRAGVQ